MPPNRKNTNNHKHKFIYKLILAIKCEAMKTEQQSSVYFIHDCCEEGSLQANLKQKLVYITNKTCLRCLVI